MLDKNINEYHFVCVGGILGELLLLKSVGSYFEETKSILNELGAEDVEIYQPNSFFDPMKNSKKLLNYLTDLNQKSQKKIVLICHSKGCLEALFTLLQYPDAAIDLIHKVFCVQPPFKGSTLTSLSSIRKRFFFMNWTYHVGSVIWPGMESLGKDKYSEIFFKYASDEKLKKHVEDLLVIVKGSKAERENIASILKIGHRMLGSASLDSDGLLTIDDQDLPGFNLQTMVFPMDHSDMFTSNKISKESYFFKHESMLRLVDLI
jgi:hypothetical protein